ncbi:MAG: acetate--CoA ligase family protein [Firmicutes bacterium]|nr:acetate--CoA ligase family protein [Bacillota bacterium]
MSVDALFTARSVAVVGASAQRHYPRSIIENLRLVGFPDSAIYPVNPRYSEVMGLPCYPSLQEVPTPPDLVVLVTRRETVLPLLDEMAAAGSRTAVVLADGYAEQGEPGRLLQAELVAKAQGLGLSVLGPNTLGFLAPGFQIAAWAGGALESLPRPGNLSLAFQSSGTLNLILNLAAFRQLGLRAAVSVGNEAVWEVADFLSYYAADPGTEVVGLFLETTVHPRRLVEALQALQQRRKPVVVLKIGRSERARQNALAHTGRMASSGEAWEALFRQVGAVVARDLDQFLETLQLFSHLGPAPSVGGLAIATISGGDCGLLSDLAADEGVQLADLSPRSLDVLRAEVGKPSLIGNPLDCENLGREDPEKFARCLRTLAEDAGVSAVAYRMNLSPQPTERLIGLYRHLLEYAKAAGKPCIVLSRAAEPLDAEWFRWFSTQGVPFLLGYRTALGAMGRWQHWRPAASDWHPSAIPELAEEAAFDAVPMDYPTTQRWLEQSGIPYAPSYLAKTPEQAAQLAQALGFPAVVKVVASGVAHKSDLGGVKVGLGSGEEVLAACRAIEQALAVHAPAAQLQGFEVQREIRGVAELILGMQRDPLLGPVVMVGMGGIFAEVFHDLALALPPIDPAEATRLLQGLRGYPLLTGVRGRPAANLEALSELIARFSAAVGSSEAIQAVDLNPVIVGEEEAVAVDALVVTRAGMEGR